MVWSLAAEWKRGSPGFVECFIELDASVRFMSDSESLLVS